MLRDRGLAVEVEFLYAVFEDRAAGAQAISYHDRHPGPAPAGMRAIPPGEIPRERIADRAERSMPERHCAEFRHGAFGVYLGNETEGQVRRLAGP